jgi:hypothetical protein
MPGRLAAGDREPEDSYPSVELTGGSVDGHGRVLGRVSDEEAADVEGHKVFALIGYVGTPTSDPEVKAKAPPKRGLLIALGAELNSCRVLRLLLSPSHEPKERNADYERRAANFQIRRGPLNREIMQFSQYW